MGRVYEPEMVDGEVSGGDMVVSGGGTLQRVQTRYSTAVSVQRPRELAQVMRSLEQEADLAGEHFYYGWSAGRERIEGPSVDLAMAAARCWGNCAIDSQPVQDTEDAWIFTHTFVDLETGFTVSRQFRQSKKWNVYGKLDDERKDDVRFQIGQSKSARNVILSALPKSLVAKAMDRAKSGVRKRIEEYIGKNGIAKAVDIALAALAKAGAKEDRVFAKLGVVARGGITVEHLVILRGDIAAIESGQDRAEDLYPTAVNGNRSRAEEITAKIGGNGTSAPVQPQVVEAQVEEVVAPSSGKPQKARKPTVARIKELFKALSLEDGEIELILHEAGAGTVDDIMQVTADSLIKRLEDALAKKRAQREPGIDPE